VQISGKKARFREGLGVEAEAVLEKPI